jgi:putative transposase
MEDAPVSSENVTEPKTEDAVSAGPVDQQLVNELVGRAKAEGLQLTGEGSTDTVPRWYPV